LDWKPLRHSWTPARAAALGLALASALAGQAEPAPEPPAAAAPASLAELERQALAEAPGLRAARERLAAAEARLAGRGHLPDPMLEVEVMDALPTGGRPLDVRPMVRQSLPARGKRAAERTVAAAEIEVARAELALAERLLLADLRAAWAAHWRVERERALLADAHEAMELLVADADARLAGGAGEVGEALAARRMVRRHELEMEDADAAFLAAVSRLAEVVGSEPPPAVPHGVELGGASMPDVDIAATVASDPRLAVAAAREALAAERLAAIRLELRPDWTVAAGARSMEGDTTELVVGLGVELPVFRRRRVEPEIAAAERELAAARAEADLVRRTTRGELERLYAERFRLEARARRLSQGLIPELAAGFEVERAALLDGGSSIAGAARLLEEQIAARLELERVRAALFEVGARFLSFLPDDSDGGTP
jgi:outer membrane protein, heavy metal efflux system